MRRNARYGWRPDLPDARDYRFSAVRPAAAAPLPAHVDLRAGGPPVYDQGELGSCTGNAIAAAIDHGRRKLGLPFLSPSRLAIYWEERAIEGTVDQDAGAEIRDGIKAVARVGAGPEALWPYDIGRYREQPGGDYYTAALANCVRAYSRLDSTSLVELKTCLAQGDPFIFGFTIYESFESQDVARTGVVAMPRSDEGVIGGHAVLAVGYDDAHRAFFVRNSWGADWGVSGHFWLPYDYLTNPSLADDCWDISLVGYGPAA